MKKIKLAVEQPAEQPMQQPLKHKDVIITKYKTVVEYDKNGNKCEKRIGTETNISKKMAATKKLVKEDRAQETLAEIEKLFQIQKKEQ